MGGFDKGILAKKGDAQKGLISKLLATHASHASRRARAAPARARLHERFALPRHDAHPVLSIPGSLTRPRYFGFVSQKLNLP